MKGLRNLCLVTKAKPFLSHQIRVQCPIIAQQGSLTLGFWFALPTDSSIIHAWQYIISITKVSPAFIPVIHWLAIPNLPPHPRGPPELVDCRSPSLTGRVNLRDYDVQTLGSKGGALHTAIHSIISFPRQKITNLKKKKPCMLITTIPPHSTMELQNNS